MDTTDKESNGAGLAMHGNAGNVHFSRVDRTHSLARDWYILILALTWLTGQFFLHVNTTVSWKFWAMYALPVYLIWYSVSEMRSELSLRRRVKSGDIEIVDLGSFYMVVNKSDKRLEQNLKSIRNKRKNEQL